MQSGTTISATDGLDPAALPASFETPLEPHTAKPRRAWRDAQGRLARWLARQVPFYEYDETCFFSSDGAPEETTEQRQAGFMRLSALYETRFRETRRRTVEVKGAISDLQFTDAYRVPFQYSRIVRQRLEAGAFMQGSSGVMLTDLDGNEFYDVAGSYGVNVLGYDAYKRFMQDAFEHVRRLGPVLGPYHPVIAYNVARLKEISGLDEISFHMSGTEAIMQAVRLARYHTGRRRIVCFRGAYHGWWGDVQPGLGNPVSPRDTCILQDMDEASLRALESRRDIACVLVNPLQALHPNKNAPADSSLLDSARTARFDKRSYARWLTRLREICDKQAIPLIFDEVFVGFRLGIGGAQEYFGVRADLVTYGKTLGGGLPIGVLCGRKHLMKRFREDRPADICFARGTFNSHPYVMAAMHEFLRHLETREARALYADLDEPWNARAMLLNHRLREEGLPVQVANMSSIWVVCYTQPSRYNWMLQYYLRAEGLALSWVGTGRLIFSLNYTERDFDAVANRFVAAAKAMQQDGWWWQHPGLTNTTIRRRILKEIIAHRLSSMLPARQH
jgi:glutamate-1-semialdehyde 2,1-aminomutase